MKLNRKINIIITVLTLLIILVIGLFGYKTVVNVIQNSIASSQIRSSQSVMKSIDRLLYEKQQNIQTIAEEQYLEKLLSSINSEESLQDATKRLNELTHLSGPWDIIFIVDIQGKIVLSTDQGEIGKDISEEGESEIAWQNSLKNQIYVSGLVVSPNTGRPTKIYAAPIKSSSPTREIIGVAIGNFSWPIIQEILSEETGAHLHLYSMDGIFLASNQGEDKHKILTEKNESVLQRHDHMSRVDSFQLGPSNEDDFDAVITYVHEQGYLDYAGDGWMLVSEVPTAVAFQSLRQLLVEVSLLMAIVAIVALGILAMAMRKFVVGPIEKLTSAADDISRGNLDSRVQIQSSDEVGELALSFNTMANKIQESSQDLEEKVEARTKEADNLNDMLKILNTIMRHDIMNDISAVEGNIEIYKNYKSKKTLNELLEVLGVTIKRSKGLIYKMKDLEKAMASGNELKSTDAKVIAQKAITDFADDGLKVSLSGDDAQIEADEALFSIFINLFRNSRMHGKAKNIAVNIKDLDKSVEISVADDGQGIPDEIKSQLFREGAKFGDTGNTGLGLYVTKKTMTRYGGDVTVKDNSPKGAVFTLTFPKQSISKETIDNLLSRKGDVKGIVFKTDSSYIRDNYGQRYIDKLKKVSTDLGIDLPYDDVKEDKWYPIGLRAISLIIAKQVFSLSDKDIRQMGSNAPNISSTTRLFTKYFVSLEKLIEKSQEIWHEHYSIGNIKILKLDEKEKKLLLTIENIKLDHIYTLYLEGYLESIMKFVKPNTKGSQVKIKVGEKIIDGFKFEW